jgi:AcrR family transcriptional regulator
LGKNGYQNVKIEDISAVSGVAVSSIYLFFKSKEGIASAIIERGWEDFSFKLKAAFEKEKDPRKRIELITDQFLPSILVDPDFISVLLADPRFIQGAIPKLDALAELFREAVMDFDEAHPLKPTGLSINKSRISVLIFLLGSLSASQFSAFHKLDISNQDLIEYIQDIFRLRFEEAR